MEYENYFTFICSFHFSFFTYIILPLENLVGYIFLQSRLNEEQDRCNIYIDASTKKPLIATAEKQLLERHISAILDKVQMPCSYT